VENVLALGDCQTRAVRSAHFKRNEFELSVENVAFVTIRMGQFKRADYWGERAFHVLGPFQPGSRGVGEL
jgi:hypothetical protein